ncbi:MAG: hypothetical protein ACI8RD_008794 [Bacillariaceae sp.]|jgi:hypothetical protein
MNTTSPPGTNMYVLNKRTSVIRLENIQRKNEKIAS